MKLFSSACLLVAMLVVQQARATAYMTASSGLANWSSTTTWSPNGLPGPNDTVEIRSGAVVIVDTNASTTVSCGGLIIDAGGALENVTTSGQSTLNIYGNLVNSNSSSAGFANGGSSATKITFASGNATWTGSGDTSAGKFYVIVNSGVTLDISGLTTGIKFKSGTGTTQFTVNGTLIAGTQVINANGNANNTFVLGSGATLKTANPNGIFLSGSATPMLNYVTPPTLNAAANFVFNGSAAQVTAGLPSAFNNLTISNTNGVTLSAPCTVSGSLTLAGSILKTSATGLLTMGSSGLIVGASSNSFISGPLAQVFSTPVSKTYPIGTNGNYRPVSLNLTTLSGTPSITVTPHEPSSLGASVAGVPLFTNRNWTVASSVGSGNIATLTLDGTGFLPANSAVLLAYNASSTNIYPTTFTVPNYSAAGIGLTASSDFALGDCTPPSTAPSGVAANTPGCSPVTLSWNFVAGAASYNVYRKLNGGSYGTPIGNSFTTGYSDLTAINGSNYVYAVTAVAACGGESAKSIDSNVASPSSNLACVITPPVNVSTGFGFTPTFTLTTINTASYQWQFSANGGLNWLNVTNGTGGTTASYVTGITTTNMNGYQYRAVAYGGCSVAVTSTPATLTILNYDPFDFIRLVWLTNLLNAAATPTSVASTATKYWTGSSPINTSPSAGSYYLWSDLPLGSVSANMVNTFQRLQSMALAYALPTCSLYTNAALATAIANGLDWMNANVYTKTATSFYDNWFHWEISGAQAFNNTVVELYPFLNSTQISNYCAAVDNFGPDSAKMINSTFGWPQLTGANLSSAVLVGIVRGALGKNNGKIVEAQTNLSRAFPYVTSGDGFYNDGSYIFHGNVAYNGQYGLVQLETVGNLVNLLHNSPWEITDPGVANVYAWATYLEPFIYNGALMDMVRGRDLTTSEYTAGAQAVSDIRFVAGFATDANIAAALNNFANTPRLASGQFHYYNMDRIVALRSGFGFGLSMSSTRIANYENETVVPSAANNMKGWDTGDGMTYLYTGNADSNFTDTYWATVDYYHLPGTTSATNWNALPNTTDQDWVGGAQVANTYGVAGMSLHPIGTNGVYSTLNAKKSWFMLDNEIVCLGSGINCNDPNAADTTVENRRLLGASPTNNFWVNGVQIAPNIGWSSNLTSASWCALDGVGGYYFPGGANNLLATFTSNSGKWTDIRPTASDAATYTDNYLKLYFKHGVRTTNATYAYVLLPNLSAASVSNYAAAPDIIVLTNTSTVQAVSKPSLGVVAANFWTTGTNSAGLISVNNKASVITLQNSNVLSVGISDPTHNNGGTITLTLNQSAASVVSADPEVTVAQLTPKIILSVDVGGTLGRAIQASFITNSVAVSNNVAPVIISVGMIGTSAQFRIQFTGNSNFTQTVLSTTNLATPLANWTVLGVATQITNGVFEFIDPTATNSAQRFYQLRSP